MWLTRWRALPVAVRDAAGVALLAGPVLAPASGSVGVQLGDLPLRSADPLGVLTELAMWLPLVVRRWRPAVALGIVGAGFAVHELLGYRSTGATLGLYVAVYSVGAHLTGRRWWVAGAGTVAYAALAVGLAGRGSPNGPGVFAAGFLVLVVCWQAGAWVRRRQLEEAGRRQRSVEAAIQGEQARIARELHDVVTHHVTAMVVQADAAQFVPGAGPEPVVAGLGTISETGRRALADLRDLLNVLSPSAEGEPADRPTPGRIGDLVAQSRDSGQPVELVETGERTPGPAERELALYRVVQEALTNALKHATGAATTVRVEYGAEGVEVEITTTGATTAPVVQGSGRGLTGLQRRIETVGGELVTGPTAAGGFRVWAWVPAR